MIPRIKKLYAKIGVLGVGHQVYWNQFDGLLEEMHRKQNVLIEKLKLNKVDTINLGLIDNAKSAYAKIPEIKSSDIDVLFIDMCTYATSSVIGIIFKEINIPIVMIALQPLKA
ncbi:MAG TPA: hypothetical protein P5105_00580, partial [Victivallales bacterium]|nr:hypothetical protein [Victivallales bacterium]